jgi:hypothetical protein
MENNNDRELIDSIDVVSGCPNPQELAAVISVVLEANRQQASAKLIRRASWARNESILRTGIVVGNGQWGSKYKQGL